MSELRLPARLDLAAAEDLLARLKLAAAGEGNCRLLAGEVIAVGTACLQALLAFDTTLQRSGRRIALIDPSAALVEGMRLLGLEDVATRWMGAE